MAKITLIIEAGCLNTILVRKEHANEQLEFELVDWDNKREDEFIFPGEENDAQNDSPVSDVWAENITEEQYKGWLQSAKERWEEKLDNES